MCTLGHGFKGGGVICYSLLHRAPPPDKLHYNQNVSLKDHS